MTAKNKIDRAIAAQALVNNFMAEQQIACIQAQGALHERLCTAELQLVGFRLAMTVVATVLRDTSPEQKKILDGLLTTCREALPEQVTGADFHVGLNALSDEAAFSPA